MARSDEGDHAIKELDQRELKFVESPYQTKHDFNPFAVASGDG